MRVYIIWEDFFLGYIVVGTRKALLSQRSDYRLVGLTTVIILKIPQIA